MRGRVPVPRPPVRRRPPDADPAAPGGTAAGAGAGEARAGAGSAPGAGAGPAPGAGASPAPGAGAGAATRPGAGATSGADAGPPPGGGAGTAPGVDVGAGERGAVTVEAALALCSLAVFLAVAIGAVGAVAASVRCIDASRELARLAARGEPDHGRAVAAALAPRGARLDLVVVGGDVTAEVSADLLPPLPLRVSGRAVAALEPGAGAP